MSSPLWIGVGIGTEIGTATITTGGEFTISSHGLVDGQPVRLDELTGGAGGPFAEGTTYYVVDADTNTFSLVSIPGDTVITLGSSGGADVHTAVPHYTARELRQAQGMFLFGGVSDRFGARAGVHPSDFPYVTLSGTTWTVEEHRAVLYPGETSAQGPYVVAVQEESDSLDPADGSNDRVDAIDLEVQDDDEDSSGSRRVRVVYTAGTPAADPDPPTLVSGRLRLATITVPAGGSPSPSRSTEAPFTAAVGGILLVRDEDELPTDGLHEGMTAWDIDEERLVVRSSGSWRRLATPRMPVLVDEGSGSGSTVDVTVPPGEFSHLQLTLRGHLDAVDEIWLRINNDSSTIYQTARIVRRASDGGVNETVHSSPGSTFVLGQWGTNTGNTATVDLFNTDTSSFVGFQARVGRMSGTDSDHRLTDSWGRLTSSLLVSSLRIRTSGDGDFSSLRWHLVGWPV